MRNALLLAFAATMASVGAAQAQEWCGWRVKSIIQCGYSTAEQCASAVGKDGVCFVNPNAAALNPSPGGGGWSAEGRPGGGFRMADEIARRLRKTMTPQEVKLWVHLRSWRQRGFHFRRQSPREGYIVDFVCMRHKLVVEIDGGQHNLDPHAERDARRDRRLVQNGFTVLRFWNNEVDRNLEGVLTLIDVALRDATPPGRASRGHPPPSGEG